MGLFSSKVTYSAYAGSSSLFPEAPATLKSRILQNSISNEQTMGKLIVDVIQTDTFARAKSMMRYAERYDDPTKDGGYIRGFPTSNLNLIIIDPVDLNAALARAVGSYDTVLYTLKGRYNEKFFLSTLIQENWTNTAYFNWPAGLPDPHWDETMDSVPIPVVNPDTGAYYTSDNNFQYTRYVPQLELSEEDLREIIGGDRYTRIGEESITTEYEVSFPYTDNTGTLQLYELERRVDIGEDTPTKEWIMTAYTVGEQVFYWTYEIGSGVDPELENAISRDEREGQYLPVAVLMQDQVWFNEDPDSELAITTNKLLKRFATSGDEIREEFEAAEEENPTKGGKKWDFIIHFAVPLETKVRGSKEYLWFYFNELDKWSTYDTQHYYDYLGGSGSQPVNEIVIKEAGVNGYNVAYRWSYIHVQDFPGEYTYEKDVPDLRPINEETGEPIGPAPFPPTETYTLKAKEITTEIVPREEFDTANYQSILDSFFGPGTPIGAYNDPDKEKDDANGFHDFFYMIRQNPEDPNNPGVPQGYQKMIVMGLSMQYTINTSADPTKKNGYRFRYATPQLAGDAEQRNEFRIPLLYKSLRDVPVLHREEAVADGFTGTVFLVVKEKVKWYQTGFFKWLIIIIAVVLIVLSIVYAGGAGTEQGVGLISAMVSATGATGLAAFTLYVVFSFAVGWIIATAASNIGGTWGTVFAVVAAIAFFYSAGGFQNIGQSWSAAIESPGWGTAVSLINATAPIYNMGWTVYSQAVLASLQDDMERFMETAKEKQQALKDAYDNLGDTPDWIDPMDLVNMFRRVGSSESANSYLTRTLTPNPGVLGFEAISEFPNIALMLPQDLQEQTVIDSMMDDFAKQRGAV